MEDLAILVVNINNLKYTMDLFDDLMRQTHPYALRMVDQNSIEEGTKEFFETIRGCQVVMNDKNVPLNMLWNIFYRETTSRYLCLLNNDVRIPTNFVSDTIKIFEREPSVGSVIHATNHPDHQKTTELNYEILPNKFVQGWDLTIRRESYTVIPENLGFFGGDDFLYVNMYRNGWKTAVALSSPIIHFNKRSRKYYPGGRRGRRKEHEFLRSSGYERLSYRSPYTRWRPTFSHIIEKGEIYERGKM